MPDSWRFTLQTMEASSKTWNILMCTVYRVPGISFFVNKNKLQALCMYWVYKLQYYKYMACVYCTYLYIYILLYNTTSFKQHVLPGIYNRNPTPFWVHQTQIYGIIVTDPDLTVDFNKKILAPDLQIIWKTSKKKSIMFSAKKSLTWTDLPNRLTSLSHLGVEPKIGGFYPQNGWWK